MLIRGAIRGMIKVARIPLRALIGFVWGVPFEDIKRPCMVYGKWKNPDGACFEKIRISDGAFIYQKENIYIEDDVFVGHFTWLDGSAKLIIRQGAQISGRAGLFTHSSHVSIRASIGNESDLGNDGILAGFILDSIEIGRYAFIGNGATILPGVNVGECAIVGAGAVVTKSVEPFAVVAGNPARKIGDVRTMDAKNIRDKVIQ